MNNMYKPDPNQPKVVPTQTSETSETSKVTELENKLRQLTEQHNKLQADFDRLTRSVKRQGSDVNSIFGRINQVR